MTRGSGTTRSAAVGALVGPLEATALLLARGYRLLPLGGLRSATGVALYVLAAGTPVVAVALAVGAVERAIRGRIG